LRGLLKPGGLRRDLNLHALPAKLRALEPIIITYMQALEVTNSHLDRLITTGHLPQKTAFDQGATGPIKRASGIERDLRRDHPYAAYDQLPMKIPVRTEGDAHARVQVRMEEIRNSIDLILRAVEEAPEGPVDTVLSLSPGGEGLGWCEGPRGSIYYCVHFDPVGKTGACESEVRLIFQLACLSVHRPRHQHDGLRDQRGKLRTYYGWLRPLEGGNTDADLDSIRYPPGNRDECMA
jgi:formate hydrogenlyase subunit 5